MGLTTRTGLIESVRKPIQKQIKNPVELKCQISRAPFILRPFGGLYNPFSFGCSILCNHPADADVKDVVRRAKDAMVSENKELLAEEMAALEATLHRSEKHVTHETTVDFVPEELFRRYTQTDSRPLTPAPTLASAVSRGSLRRRCLTPDQPPVPRKTLVLDLRRSHSQETLYWHGYQTSDISSGLGLSSLGASHQTPSTSSPTKLTVTTSDSQMPPLVSQATLLRRSPYMRGTVTDRGIKVQTVHLTLVITCDNIKLMKHGITLFFKIPKDEKDKAKKSPKKKVVRKNGKGKRKDPPRITSPWLDEASKDFFTYLENQIKALQTKHLMQIKSKTASEELDKGDEAIEIEQVEIIEEDTELPDVGSDIRRRGRKKKGRHRVMSAVLVSNTQNDPETQIAGIGSESHNPSSRASIAQPEDISSHLPSAVADRKKSVVPDSFLDPNILKSLQREVDNLTIESEFNPKRRYIYEEAMRTRQEKTFGKEMSNLLNEMKLPPLSLDKWLHTPRVFSRKNAVFSLPIDRRDLVGLSPMQYVANYVNVSSSKHLLYHTVLEKFSPGSYSMPLKHVSEALQIMMGETLSNEMLLNFESLLGWESLTQEDINKLNRKNILECDEFSYQNNNVEADNNNVTETNLFAEFDVEPEQKEVVEEDVISINFRLWCSICGLCERLYGPLPSVKRDPPHEVEVADFDTLQGKLMTQKVDHNLSHILTQIQKSHGNYLY